MSHNLSSPKADKGFLVAAVFAVICIMVGLVALPVSSYAASAVSLSWSAATEPDIAGYKVYYGTTQGSFSAKLNVGKYTGCVISGLTAGKTYYFVATAYNADGLESNYSTVLSYTVPSLTSKTTATTAVYSSASSTSTLASSR